MKRTLRSLATLILVAGCVVQISPNDTVAHAAGGGGAPSGHRASASKGNSSLLSGILGGNSNLAGGSTPSGGGATTAKPPAATHAKPHHPAKKGGGGVLGKLLGGNTNFLGSSPSGSGSGGKTGSKGVKPGSGKSGAKTGHKARPGAFSVADGEASAGYSAVLGDWLHAGVTVVGQTSATVAPTAFRTASGPVSLLPLSQCHGYGQRAFAWTSRNPFVQFGVTVPRAGLYAVQIQYYTRANSLIPIDRGVLINGHYQYFESQNVELHKVWADASRSFPMDSFGNEMPQGQVGVGTWQSAYVMDHTYLHDRPLLFYFHAGQNTVRLTNISGSSVLLGQIRVLAPPAVPSYQQYLAAFPPAAAPASTLLTYQAEAPYVKSNSSIQAQASANPASVPFRAGLITMNTLGGASWQTGGQSVTWKVRVKQSGVYHLAFKYEQNVQLGLPVFRQLQIDGRTPFAQALRVAFPYAQTWSNKVIASPTGQPYGFYLTKGQHYITLIVNPAPYRPVIRAVEQVMSGIDQLSLQIRMVTGNTLDQNRTWDIVSIIPNLAQRLNGYAAQLQSAYHELTVMSDGPPAQAQNLAIAVNELRSLAKKPEQVPYRFNELAQSPTSVNEMLGQLLTVLPQQPLLLDQFYVYHNAVPPKPTVGLWPTLMADVTAFVHSFTTNYSLVGKSSPNSLVVWVNRPRQYVSLMQELANSSFTKDTGIKVTMMLMPNEQKLILANASGQTPDVALGVVPTTAFNMGVRGALLNLRTMPQVNQVLSRFSPGALLPLEFNKQLYAIPETQDFWVLFYRKDILSALHLPVPQTWNQVIQMLPVLQRYGMNFYDPIAGAGGYKPYATTVPFIYQAGGKLFHKNGLTTAIDSNSAINGFRLMTNLFSVYGIPQQIPNFYTHFVQGDLPVGVADFGTYVQLVAAAPQINGLWGIAPMPGIRQNGRIVRYAPGTGEVDFIFKNSHRQQAAWKFLQWWTSTHTQVTFANDLQTTYGPAFVWNSSNLRAFRQLPWPQSDINTVLQQWKWLKDVPHVPGDYMLERELSNAWNSVVFSGVNARQAIQDAAITADREIRVQLEELGYLSSTGRVLKPIVMPDSGN